MNSWTKQQKVAIFRRCFRGREDVYGTYDPATGRSYQVKSPVTDRVILDHLRGRRPYGVYLLCRSRTQALAVDFDDGEIAGPAAFLRAARDCGLDPCLERSKSKGYHVWLLFAPGGVAAWKPRRIAQKLLDRIGRSDAEIFPKQDALNGSCRYGNFINAPLFGRLVPRGRTVLLDPDAPERPLPDPWSLLESLTRASEEELDAILTATSGPGHPQEHSPSYRPRRTTLGLPPCAQRMLAEGVTANQRVACFRLAVALKLAGLPRSAASAVLVDWARKNRPIDGKRIVTPTEIRSQLACAYRQDYRGRGCEEPAVRPYCDTNCALIAARSGGQKWSSFVEDLPASRADTGTA